MLRNLHKPFMSTKSRPGTTSLCRATLIRVNGEIINSSWLIQKSEQEH